MKLAVVINVEPGTEALKHALRTQMLLLDRMGARLDSIRLAAPRLLHRACTSAIAERPDALVVSGGPRSARRAGQLAYEHGVPILFLPGFRSAEWGKLLWGTLSLEAMIESVVRSELIPGRLDVASAGNQIFFDFAVCGMLPQLAELHQALEEADTFSEGWQVLERATSIARNIWRPRVRFHTDDLGSRRATALIVTTNRPIPGGDDARQIHQSALCCAAFRHGPIAYAGAILRCCLGGDWRGNVRVKYSEHKSLTVDAGTPAWLLLDGEPMSIEGPVEFRLLPEAIQTFRFGPPNRIANDNSTGRARVSPSVSTMEEETPWNFPSPYHVAFHESRLSGDARYRKQV